MNKNLLPFFQYIFIVPLIYFGLYEKVDWVENLALFYYWLNIGVLFILNGVLLFVLGVLCSEKRILSKEAKQRIAAKHTGPLPYILSGLSALAIIALGYLWMGGIYLGLLVLIYSLMCWFVKLLND